ARRLPYVDLAVTAGVGLAVNYYLRWTTRVRLNFLISWTLALLSLSVGVFWLLLRADAPGVAAALYLWVGIFAVLIPSQVWSLAGAAFTTRQAKRLFSIIGSGGILGAALGGNFAGYVGPRIGTDWIL